MTIPQHTGSTSAVQGSATTGVPQQAIQGGLRELVEIQQELDEFANRGADAPNWTALVSRFKATLDQMSQACGDLGWESYRGG